MTHANRLVPRAHINNAAPSGPGLCTNNARREFHLEFIHKQRKRHTRLPETSSNPTHNHNAPSSYFMLNSRKIFRPTTMPSPVPKSLEFCSILTTFGFILVHYTVPDPSEPHFASHHSRHCAPLSVQSGGRAHSVQVLSAPVERKLNSFGCQRPVMTLSWCSATITEGSGIVRSPAGGHVQGQVITSFKFHSSCD